MPPTLSGHHWKTEGNPGFSVKMREGAQEKAKELGLDGTCGKPDGDSLAARWVAAIENLISAGAKGFMIVLSDLSAIVPTIKKARDAGLLVISLDTPLDPMDAADATFATDNFKAGELIGAWAKGTPGDKAADAKIAFLDLAVNQPTVDYLRDQGFMKGFGIDIADPSIRRRGRSAHLRPRDDRRRRGWRPYRHGDAAAEMPGRERRIFDQRAGGCWRLRGAEGGRQG